MDLVAKKTQVLSKDQIQANLRALSSLKKDFNRIRSQEGENYAATHRSQAAGGVRLVGVVVNVFKKTSPKAISTNFEVLLFRVDSALLEGQETYLKTDPETGKPFLEMDLPEYSPPKDNPPLVTPELKAQTPKTCKFESFVSTTFSIFDKDAGQLKSFTPNDIIFLNGAKGRLAVLMSKNPDTNVLEPDSEHWAVFNQVSSVERTGLTMTHLWAAAQGIPSSHFAPNDKAFIPMDKSSRYNRDQSYWVSQVPVPDQMDKEASAAYDLATATNCCYSVLDAECLTQEKALEADAPKDAAKDSAAEETTKQCARLTYTHYQWPEDETLTEDNKQIISVGVTAFDEMLTAFGIPTVDMWKALAPRILSNLQCKWFGYVDTRGTTTSFGGIGQSSYHFALQLIPTVFIPDTKSVCEKIGIPVTAEYVKTFLAKPGVGTGPVNRNTTRCSRAQVLSQLPPVVPMSGKNADPTVGQHLLQMSNTETPPKFFAMINCTESANNYELINALTPEHGSLIVDAFCDNSMDGVMESEDSEMLISVCKALSISTLTGTRYCIIQAVCDGVVPEDAVMKNNKKLMQFMQGPTAVDAQLLEDSAASSSSSAAAAAAAASARSIPKSTVTITDADSDQDLFGDGGKEEEDDAPSSTAAAAAAAAASSATPSTDSTVQSAKKKSTKRKMDSEKTKTEEAKAKAAAKAKKARVKE